MKLIALLFCISLSFALEFNEIDAIMQTNINETLEILKNSPKNTDDIQKIAQKIFALFDPIFDYPLMANLALSKHAKTLNSTQIQDFMQAFTQNLKKNFTDKLKLYKDENLEVLGGEKPKDNRYNLKTGMLLEGKLSYIIFKFYDKNNNWKIYDVDILGISVIQTYRSQIDDILLKSDFNALINTLQNGISFETKPL